MTQPTSPKAAGFQPEGCGPAEPVPEGRRQKDAAQLRTAQAGEAIPPLPGAAMETSRRTVIAAAAAAGLAARARSAPPTPAQEAGSR